MRVTVTVPHVVHDGVRLADGTTLDIPDAAARQLIDAGAAREAEDDARVTKEEDDAGLRPGRGSRRPVRK